jgi:hypothetical protein
MSDAIELAPMPEKISVVRELLATIWPFEP